METSRAETGSSAMMTWGSRASARAIAMRWRWPPENSCGYFRMNRGARPTRRMSSATRAGTSAAGQTAWTSSGSARVAYTVSRGLSDA